MNESTFECALETHLKPKINNDRLYNSFVSKNKAKIRKVWTNFANEVPMFLYNAFSSSGNQFTHGALRDFHFQYARSQLLGPQLVGGIQCSSFKSVLGITET